MKVIQVVVGYISENCYIAYDEESKEAILIDPGEEADKIIEVISENECIPQAILLTHGHYDHTGAVNELREHYGIKVYANEEEEIVFQDRTYSLWTKHINVDEFWKDGHEFEIAHMKGKMLFTPGHTPGGACYYFEQAQVLFSGDTLFSRSVGRSDFKGGSASQLIRGIQEKLMVLPEETIVYPGHMETTTIGAEKVYNPFLM